MHTMCDRRQAGRRSIGNGGGLFETV